MSVPEVHTSLPSKKQQQTNKVSACWNLKENRQHRPKNIYYLLCIAESIQAYSKAGYVQTLCITTFKRGT